MAVLGGGGPQTLYGHNLVANKIWEREARVGLLAGVGEDLPPEVVTWMGTMGIDRSGLLESTLPTPRAWQLFEADGRRTQVWRCEASDGLYSMLRPAIADFPEHYRGANVYHLGIHPERFDLDYLQGLRALTAHPQEPDEKQDPLSRSGLRGPPGVSLWEDFADAAEKRAEGLQLSLEPFTVAENPMPATRLAQLCAVCDIFSPNELEASTLVGPGTPQQMVDALAEAGARMVLLRCGAAGSLVYRRDTEELWQVPAVPAAGPVHPTGCGNAYMGGFLAAWSVGKSIVDAGVWGSVAASFMLEVPGIPPPELQGLKDEMQRRFEATRERAVCLRPAKHK